MFSFNYWLEYNRYFNIIGILLVLFVCYIFSTDRNKVSWKLILRALGLQSLICYLVLKTSLGEAFVQGLASGITKLYQYAEHGAAFVFGSLTDSMQPWGFIFAFKVLPITIFFAALTSILLYWKVIPVFGSSLNKLIRPLLGTSSSETLCSVGNSFLGPVEAPLLIKNYLNKLTKSEIFVVMVSGMATISSSILAVYAAMGVPAKHMLASSIMAIPSSILIAKLLMPSETNENVNEIDANEDSGSSNFFNALAVGTSDGLNLVLHMGAALIVFTSLLMLVNNLILWFSGNLFSAAFGLNDLLGYIFSPLGYLLGFTGEQTALAGQLLGIKIAANELLAYQQMLNMHASERFIVIMTYALCGFSNFSVIGIQVGGIGALAPSKRILLSELGVKAVFAGALSNLMSAFIAGIIL